MICDSQSERWFAVQYEIESLTNFWSKFSGTDDTQSNVGRRTSGLYRAECFRDLWSWQSPAIGDIEESCVIHFLENFVLSFRHVFKVETFSGSGS